MRRREPYTPCKLYVDGIPKLEIGHFIETPAGSAYLVQGMRVSRDRPARRNLDCVRWPIAAIPPEATRWTIHWYRRDRRPRS